MKVVSYQTFGGPEVLSLVDEPLTSPGPGRVRVRVRAASINPIDGKFRRGELTFLSGRRFPKRVGGDFAGVVDAVGEGVTALGVGDPVFGMVDGMRGGAWAESVITRAELLVRKPAAITFEEAAAVPVVGLAAFTGLHRAGRVRPGTRLLLNGAAGGVGVMAIQIATALGAEVSATATGDGLELARELGAHRLIDYRRTDVTTGPDRWDVIFDLSGRMPFAKAKRILAPGGRFVNPTPTPPVILGALMSNPFRSRKHVILLGKPSREALTWLADGLERRALRSIVSATFPLEDVREAARFAEAGGVRGKVVLTMAGA